VREGLVAVISVKLSEPRFEGQTKTKLSNSEVDGIVQKIVGEKLKFLFEKEPSIARRVIEQMPERRARPRGGAQGARDDPQGRPLRRRSAGKLADCSERDASLTELYIVEGDSAGGSPSRAATAAYQAILPLRGKLINSEKAQLDKVLDNLEIRTLITAIGTGIGSGEDDSAFHGDKAATTRSSSMTDADVDARTSARCSFTFLYRQMRGLLDRGYVYIAQPPLYKIKRKKREQYIDNDEAAQPHPPGTRFRGRHADASPRPDDFKSEQIDKIVETLAALEKLGAGLTRFGASLIEYLDLHLPQTHELPRYVAAHPRRQQRSHTNFLRNDRGTRGFHPTHGARRRRVRSAEGAGAAKPAEANGSGPTASRRITIHEIYESTEMTKLLRSMARRARYLALPAHRGAALRIAENAGQKSETRRNCMRHSKSSIHIRNLGRRGLSIQRYKGLGEMNPKQLFETTMDPDKRRLLKVSIDDAAKADQPLHAPHGRPKFLPGASSSRTTRSTCNTWMCERPVVSRQ